MWGPGKSTGDEEFGLLVGTVSQGGYVYDHKVRRNGYIDVTRSEEAIQYV